MAYRLFVALLTVSCIAALARGRPSVAERMAASDGFLSGARLVEAIPPGTAALAIGTLAVLVLVPVAAYVALGDRH